MQFLTNSSWGDTSAEAPSEGPAEQFNGGGRGFCSENKGQFEGFLGEEFAEYCVNMERSGTWGDELTLVWPSHLLYSPLVLCWACSLVPISAVQQLHPTYSQDVVTPCLRQAWVPVVGCGCHSPGMLNNFVAPHAQRAVCDAYGVIVNVVTSDRLNW